MRRNFLLVLAVGVSLILVNNSLHRLVSFKGTSDKVVAAQERLKRLRAENEDLKKELEYKKSQRFAEEEIRNKLGLAKPGEEVYVVPKDGNRESLIVNRDDDKPNWQKWREYLFEGK